MLDHFIHNNNGRKAPIMPIKNPMLECNRVSHIDTDLQDRKMTAEELSSLQCKRNILDARIRNAVDFALGYGSTEKDSINEAVKRCVSDNKSKMKSTNRSA